MMRFGSRLLAFSQIDFVVGLPDAEISIVVHKSNPISVRSQRLAYREICVRKLETLPVKITARLYNSLEEN
jgi:hypothetical protein